MLRFLTFFFVLGMVFSCSKKESSNLSFFRYPLIDSCRNEVVKKLRSISSRGYDYDIKEFSASSEYLPFITGFVEFKTNVTDKKIIDADWRMAVSDCAPNTTISVKKDEGFEGEFFNAYNIASRTSSGQIYFVEGPSELIIHFNLKE